MSIKGPRARLIFREMIRQLGDTVPPEVHLTVQGTGRRCYLTVTSGPTLPPEPDPETFHAHFGVESSISGAYGAWVPFLPHALATKLAMIDILETIQSVISSDRRSPWPGPGFVVKATDESDQIRLWFENPDGATQPAALIPANYGKSA